MPLDILMPALFPTMGEGRLARWRVREGERIAVGTVIAEIETAEGRVEVAAVEEGVITRLLVPEGPGTIAVDARIAVLASAHETEQSIGTAVRRRVASPLARRLAKSAGLDLATLAGTGTGGRVVERDVNAAIATAERLRRQAAAAPPPSNGSILIATASAAPSSEPRTAPARTQPRADRLVPALVRQPPPPTVSDAVLRNYRKGAYDIVAHDSLRQSIAERAGRSARTVPHLTLSMDCVMDGLLAAIQRINTAASARAGRTSFPITHADVLVKAMGLALQQVPAANVTWSEIGMLCHHVSDVAFEIQVEGGFLQPVIRQADLKSLSEIGAERGDLAERAERGRVDAGECEGAVTSIADLGPYGVRRAEAVIMPPHASVLAAGAAEKRPLVSGGQIVVATLMTLTLAVDQRVVDAATGAELLGAVRGFIEDPVRMLA